MAAPEDSIDLSRPPPGFVWRAPAPEHFDSAWPRWAKFLTAFAILALAYFFIDTPAARWAFSNPIHLSSSLRLEFTMLQQYGQWFCSILVIIAVALIDRDGRRKAISIAFACLATVLACYFLKGMIGRTRPDVLHNGHWKFMGPIYGMTNAKYQSFPSAHTSGAFALSVGLAWFYPNARALFFGLAIDVAFQRVWHHAHFASDTIAGAIVAVTVARSVLAANVGGRVIAMMPEECQIWLFAKNPDAQDYGAAETYVCSSAIKIEDLPSILRHNKGRGESAKKQGKSKPENSAK